MGWFDIAQDLTSESSIQEGIQHTGALKKGYIRSNNGHLGSLLANMLCIEAYIEPFWQIPHPNMRSMHS